MLKDERHEKSWPALIVPSPALNVPSLALIVPLPVNRFPNKLAPTVPKNPPDYSFLCNSVFDNFTLAEELFAKLYEALKLMY